MAMLFSVMSFAAETATLSFANKAQRTSFSDTQQIWEQNGITLTNNKANYNNNLGDYANPIRLYANTTIDIACSKGNITQIVFEANADKYVAPMQNSLGTSFGTVTVSGKNVTLKLATPAASVGAITMTAQVRLNSLTVTYEKVASAEPSITCSNSVNFGVVKANANIAKELVVEAENLTENIAVSLATGTAFTVEGDLTTTGGTLTITTTATEEGTYTDKLILTSGDVTKEVEVSAKVVVCQGEGTQENPYTVEDVIKLSNPNPTVTAWVEGYIVGVMNNNELVTSEFEVNSNIAIAATTDETEAIVPVGFPNGEVRTALNLVDNPDNMGKKVAVYGTLENYFSTTGVKNVSAYEFVNHTITVSANPAEAGTVTGGGEFEETDEITVKAVANDGYKFVNWTENEVEVSTDAEYTFAVLADRNLVANFKVAEPVIEWIEMELEIANLTTMVMEVGGKKYLQLNGRNDMEDADVTLFLNDYADADGDYVVNTETAYLTYGGLELTVVDGVMTQTTDVEKGAIYTGTVRASVTDEEEGGTMYLEFALTMYAAPAVELVLTDAIVAFDEKTGVLTFNVSTGEGEGYYVELAGYTAPGVHEGPQICLFETPEVVAYTNYAETSVADGVITLKGEFTSFMGDKFDLTISGKLPVVEEPVELVGVVKRALQIGESTIILTHEADGTAHIYNVIDEEISEISQEGVVAVDPENAGDLLAISDIALTEDGKLVAVNKIVCQSEAGQVKEGYKRGELKAYIWNDLAGAPSIWFTSKMSSNWYNSIQGHTMAYKGTSTNGTLVTTGVTATGVKFRYSVYNVIDGVYTDPAVNNSEYYHYTKGSAQTTDNIGASYEINFSLLAENTWVLDGNLVDPFEITDPLTYNTEVTAGATLTEDLGKKYNGTSYVTVGAQVLMVAPYAAEDKLAGVKVLDITSGLATATVVATADLDAAVEATAAATAVAVAENVLTITLVGDATMHLLDVELEKGPATALENIAVEGKAVKAIINGQLVIIKNGIQYNAQGQVVK